MCEPYLVSFKESWTSVIHNIPPQIVYIIVICNILHPRFKQLEACFSVNEYFKARLNKVMLPEKRGLLWFVIILKLDINSCLNSFSLVF